MSKLIECYLYVDVDAIELKYFDFKHELKYYFVYFSIGYWMARNEKFIFND